MMFPNQIWDLMAPEWASYTEGAVAAFFLDETAQDLVEYALVAVVIGLGTVAAARGLAASIGIAFSNVQAALTSGA